MDQIKEQNMADKIETTEISVDSIMSKIREEANNKRRLNSSAYTSVENEPQAGIVSVIDTGGLHAIIAATERNVDVGAEVTPMEEFSGLTRKLALFVGKKIVYFASFITFKQRNFNRGVVDALKTIAGALEKMSHSHSESHNSLHSRLAKTDALVADIGNVQKGFAAELSGMRTSLTETNNFLHSGLAETAALVADLGNVQKGFATELTEMRISYTSNQQAIIKDVSASLLERDATIKDLEQRLATLQTIASLQERRTAAFMREGNKRPGHSVPSAQLKQLPILADAEKNIMDRLYLAFEDRFRGSREEIRERIRIYLPLISEAGVGTVEAPVLDVGCGRGEWLELLQDEGLKSRGIDLNSLMVEQCRTSGLDVIEADVLNYLRSLPDSSLGAVTGFHIIEHLQFEVLIAMLDETLRILRPGGVAIFETPNPQNVLVGSYSFYIDPTHRNPLPSPLVKFIMESRGFHKTEVVNLNPSKADRIKEDTETARHFNEYFWGCQDYAVIGYKVSQSET
jgi:SAM-dependent methyltransferase